MAERQPRIWVYHLKPLYNGLDFGNTSVRMSASNIASLGERARKLFGRDFGPPILTTKGGLDNPMTIAVDQNLLSFTRSIIIYPEEPDKKIDLISWSMRDRERIGGMFKPEALQGHNFEIWAMQQYPNPDPRQRLAFKFTDESSPLFDPQVEPDMLKDPIQDVYQSLVEYDRDLAGQKPIALGWYIKGGKRFRIAVRLYRDRTLTHHGLVIATTLPKEPSQPSAA